jgi:murein L,D-transpeptidase YafK
MKTSVLLTLLILTTAFNRQTDFLSEQKKYERVKIAYKESGNLVTAELKKQNIQQDKLNILLMAYKEEQLLDIYAKNKSDNTYKKILSYTICARSGELGPKRKQGDNQVPEGFYHIDRYNPASFFYLSLGINYPNQSDRKKSNAKNLGGDIFIHGECVTIGCLPMTNDMIKEIYIYAIQARENGQLKIPVYIFPYIMNAENMKRYKNIHKNNKELIHFWSNLKTGYDTFNTTMSELNVSVDGNGNYQY